jgi:hypothetical protein
VCGILCHFALVELRRAQSRAKPAGAFWPICELERFNSRSNRPLRAGFVLSGAKERHDVVVKEPAALLFGGAA